MKRVVIIVLCISLLSVSCKVIWYNLPDLTDYKIFQSRIIHSDTSNVFNFIQNANNSINYGKTIRLNDKPLPKAVVSLDEFAVLSNSVAFLIIRNDTILYKNYRNGYSDSTIFNPMSLTKAFVSALVGIAIQEKYIKSENQYICDFIPELKGNGYDSIRIKHLLKHTSGIHYTDNNLNPFCDNSQYYYTNNLRNRILRHKIDCPPGVKYQYSSINTQLIGLIIERSTKQSLSNYLETRIWKKIGMKYNAKWSTDNNSSTAMEKAFSGLNCTALDLAKLGRLYLNKGNWNGKQLINPEWVEKSTERDISAGGRWDYQYSWGVGPKLYESFFAVGLYGQIIYVYPQKNVIIVRICEATTQYNPPFIYYTLIQLIDQL